MAVAVKTRIDNKTLQNYFGVKSYDQVLSDLALSRRQVARGEYKSAGAVTRGIRAQYGL